MEANVHIKIKKNKKLNDIVEGINRLASIIIHIQLCGYL